MNKDYIASEYRRLHEQGKFSGACLKSHIPKIKQLIEECDCKTVLDYGCGKANVHKKNKLTDNVTLYDPFYAPYSKKPEGTYDMVICTDVMEHIPLDDVESAIKELVSYTNKVLFLAIATRPAIKKFSDGTNVHLTIKQQPWWDGMFAQFCDKDIKIVRYYS